MSLNRNAKQSTVTENTPLLSEDHAASDASVNILMDFPDEVMAKLAHCWEPHDFHNVALTNKNMRDKLFKNK